MAAEDGQQQTTHYANRLLGPSLLQEETKAEAGARFELSYDMNGNDIRVRDGSEKP